MITRRLIALLVALFVLWAAPAVQAQSGDDAAIAINTKDGSQVFRFSFNVRRIMGEVVDSGNAAVAYASCESCQTVAIAIQLVLVSGSPEVVTPENLAIAINEGCVACETLASAYQFVLGVGAGPVHFTAEGNRTLAELRRELAGLDKENLTIEEIQARVESIVDRLREVIANELVTREGDGEGAAPPDQGTQTTPTGTTPTDTTPTNTTPTDTTPTDTTPTETTPTDTTPTDTTPTDTTPTDTTPTDTTPTETTPTETGP